MGLEGLKDKGRDRWMRGEREGWWERRIGWTSGWTDGGLVIWGDGWNGGMEDWLSVVMDGRMDGQEWLGLDRDWWVDG